MSQSLWWTGLRPAKAFQRLAVSTVVALTVPAVHWCMAQAPKQQANPFAKAEDEARPEPIPEFKLQKTLRTVPVPRDRPAYNYQMVDTSLLNRDKQGIWVLDFAFKDHPPLRIRTVPVRDQGKNKHVLYLYFKVVNRTGAPRMFVPQFVMVNEKGERFEDNVVPEAIPLIQSREDQSIPVLGAVDLTGMIPPSTKPDVDDAVFGAAVWEKWDPKADRFSIYIRGLSDGYTEVAAPNGGKPVAKYKTLRLDFIRRGDEHNLTESEFQLAEIPYEWVYW
ncbi:MAG TPA: hypothetical protein VFF52_06725 [Isosphaeraceae bacterium]|nr:hypothetical protein [Isosphaeraceae bacterium]